MKELPPLHRKIWRAKEKPKIRIKTDFLPNVSIKKKSSERNWWIKNYLLDVITKVSDFFFNCEGSTKGSKIKGRLVWHLFTFFHFSFMN